MQQSQNPSNDIVVINRGEEVIATLTKYVRERGYKSAWISGLGGAGAVTLGFYTLKTKEYERTTIHEPLEILNLTGNMSIVDGEPFWHIHGTFGKHDLTTVGGHIKNLVVGLTCEVILTPLDAPLTRTFDSETGLTLLQT